METADMNLPDIAAEIPDEASAYLFLENLRWGGDPTECPHPECKSDAGFYFLKPSNGKSRKTRTGAASQRRVWKCKTCRKQFSVLTGSVFHGARIPVRTIVFVVFDVCSAKNGISAREVARKYGITPRSAWYLLHRIRHAMESGEPFWTDTTIVADETYFGGQFNRMNNKQKKRAIEERGEVGARYGGDSKIPVVTLINRNTGESYSRVMNDVNRATLRAAIAKVSDPATIELHTDEARAYTDISKEVRVHEKANHSKGQYVSKNGGGTNPVESFFSQLKRSIDGTHHQVSRVHLQRYVDQFDFMYTTRQMTDGHRMQRLMGQVGGKRLTYRPIVDR